MCCVGAVRVVEDGGGERDKSRLSFTERRRLQCRGSDCLNVDA
jgi:hypothetical protein